MTNRRNAGNTWGTADTNSFHRRYMSLMASLHSLSIDLEGRYFPNTQDRLWSQRSTAVAAAVRTLIDGQHLPKRKKKEENLFDV